MSKYDSEFGRMYAEAHKKKQMKTLQILLQQ